MSHELVNSSAGVYAENGAQPYETRLYAVDYRFRGRLARCFIQLGLPAGLAGDAGLVALIVGGASNDIQCVEGAPVIVTGRPPDWRGLAFHAQAFAVLASGSSEADIRDGDPMISMLFLGPGRGSGSDCGVPGFELRSTGDPDITDTPENTTGDDYYGEMSLAAFTASIHAAREIVASYYEGVVTPKLIIVTHSDGITLGAQFVAQDASAIALVDVEGPVDSVEKTVATECFDLLGAFDPGPACTTQALPRTLDYTTWSACTGLSDTWDQDRDDYCGGHDFFRTAWPRFFRPPDEGALLEEISLYTALASFLGDPDDALEEPFDGEYTLEFDWYSVLNGEVASFWEGISAINFLPRRRVPYVRAGCRRDHAQPDHYLGRHNTRALLAAARSGQASEADLFWLKDAGEDPVRFRSGNYDPDSRYGLLPLPDGCGPAALELPFTGAMLEIDLARWAFKAWQDGVFPYRDFPSCLSDCESAQYGLAVNADARTPCVEACLRGLCGRDADCYQGLHPAFVGWIEAHHASHFYEVADRCLDEHSCAPGRRIECLEVGANHFLLVNDSGGGLDLALYRWLHSELWDEDWRPWTCSRV